MVHTPGHTEGHCAFVLESRGVLFAGDAIVMQDLFGRSRDVPQIMPDAFHNDPVRVRESLGVLAAVDADLVLPGHGEPFRGTPAEMVGLAAG